MAADVADEDPWANEGFHERIREFESEVARLKNRIDRHHKIFEPMRAKIAQLKSDLDLRNQTALDRKQIIAKLEAENKKLRVEERNRCADEIENYAGKQCYDSKAEVALLHTMAKIIRQADTQQLSKPREPKAGDILIGLEDTRCLRKGKKYRVYEDTPGEPAFRCETCNSGEARHYLTYDWRKHLAFADEAGK